MNSSTSEKTQREEMRDQFIAHRIAVQEHEESVGAEPSMSEAPQAVSRSRVKRAQADLCEELTQVLNVVSTLRELWDFMWQVRGYVEELGEYAETMRARCAATQRALLAEKMVAREVAELLGEESA